MRPRIYRMEFETLTPVMVTAGRDAVLSPYTDYVHENDRFYYLDPRKVERALAEAGDGVLDEFVRGVRTGMDNTRSNFNLRQFIRNRLNRAPADLALRSVPLPQPIGQVQVRRHVATAGQPIIPGSTIKGAIRTAIFYSWLIEDEQGKRFVDRLSARVEELWAQLRSQFETEGELLREGQRAEEQGDRDTPFRKLSEAVRLAAPARRYAEQSLREFRDEPLFGPIAGGDRGAEMRFLRVSDTAPLPPGDLRVAHVTRLRLQDGSMVSPQWSEVIRASVRTTFSLAIEPRFTLPGLAFLNEPSLSPLLERLDRFAGHCIGWDTSVLEDLTEASVLDDVFNVQVGIEEIQLLPTGSIMRLGGGKTYFDNSLGLALFRRDPKLFTRFQQLLGLGRNPITRQFSRARFPATRSYVVRRAGGQLVPVEPLGWVKVQLSQ